MTLKARITAIDRFIKGCRDDGIYDDLNACCVMAGWDSLAGALTPLKGAAPTNSGFLDADLDRGIGLTGDGSTKYLDSNRASEEDDQDSHHLAVFQTNPQIGNPKYIAGRGIVDAGTTTLVGVSSATNKLYTRSRNSADNGGAAGLSATGLLGMSRSASDNYDVRVNSNTFNTVQDSQTPLTGNIWVFRSNNVGSGSSYDGTLSFYSIGSATDLALLDARVSTLMADLRAIEEAGFDKDAIAYLRAVEEADGAFLETSVKVAINSLVSGLKAESLWDAIGASCLLCGPRTLSGALVPLRGDAPTAEGGWASGDYDRSTGMKGNGTSLYLNTGVNNASFTQDDFHMACYVTAAGTAGGTLWLAGAGGNQTGASELFTAGGNYQFRNQNFDNATLGAAADTKTGLIASSRQVPGQFDMRADDVSGFTSRASESPYSGIIHIFGSSFFAPTVGYDGSIAYYSLGSQIDMAKLRTHLDSYVTAIGAAV